MIDDTSLAIILLCSHLLPIESDYKPLTLGEWNTLVKKLVDSDLKNPVKLFNMTTGDMRNILEISKEMSERICWLLSRGAAMSIRLENLLRKGINVITRADSLYPERLRRNLKHLAPSLLFYAGDISLCNDKGIGIVGSRNIGDDSLELTKNIVSKAVSEGFTIYSGGAKGVDTAAEQVSLNKDGAVISYISDSLESKIKKVYVREQIEKKKLLLLTAVNPDAGFSIPVAMNRNKYIYASTEAVFVISADLNKGGSWTGAVENIKNKWSATLVVDNKESEGNQALIKKGAYAVNVNDQICIKDLLDESKRLLTSDDDLQLDLFSMPAIE